VTLSSLFTLPFLFQRRVHVRERERERERAPVHERERARARLCESMCEKLWQEKEPVREERESA
jgi:hypothetical protein